MNQVFIFFHGIGAGLIAYQPLISYIHRKHSQNHRIIFISMKCISMRYPSMKDIPNISEIIDSMKFIFKFYNINKAIFIGHRFALYAYVQWSMFLLFMHLHSYGTTCLSWIVQKCPQYISRIIFIDPICFRLFEPYVVYNFIYRTPYKLSHLYL